VLVPELTAMGIGLKQDLFHSRKLCGGTQGASTQGVAFTLSFRYMLVAAGIELCIACRVILAASESTQCTRKSQDVG